MRQNIDLLNEKSNIIAEPKQPKRKRKLISKIIIYLLVIFLILSVSSVVDIIASGQNLSKSLGNISLWSQIQHLIGSGDKGLAGENDDRINVLLMGIGGQGHDGANLTDTNIIASFKPSTKQVALISVPRDLYVPIPGYGWRKINNANAYGEAAQPGQGGELASQTISDVFSLPIQYYFRIDFDGFKQIIDDLGGVTIDVENTLDDPTYPIAGKETATTSERYEHLHIPAGTAFMNGDLALKYVRSRHASGIEGSDFARSKRQQKVLMAVKDKALSLSTLTNPFRISKLMDTLSQHIATNMQVYEIIKLFDLGKNVKEEGIIRRVFDDSPDGSLYSATSVDGAFILKPKAGNFSEMQLIAKNIFDPNLVEKTSPKRIEIQNGTKIGGLASRTSQYLQSLGYQIVRIKNAPTQDYQKTVIYNLNTAPQDKTAGNVAQLINAELAPAVPAWVISTTTPAVSKNVDVLIILGQDRKDL